jgi:putative transposase
MKLTVQLKLIPTPEQHTALLETMRAFNAAASHAARVGFEAGVFSQISIHKRCYRELRDRFGLSAQMAVRAIGKTVEVFKRDRRVCPVFRDTGAMTYDERLLGWKGPAHVSLLTLQGRQIVAMVYGEYQAGFLQRLKGQVDLVYRDSTFYLLATIDLPDNPPITPTRFLGVDLGIVNLATDSDGTPYTGEAVEKALAGQQARFQRWVNHGIAKRLVQLAKDTKAALVLEDLTHIRRRMTVRKGQRARQHNWSFGQLRAFIAYKAERAGVPVVCVDPRHTSQTCSRCGHVSKKNRRSQAEFSCLRCGYTTHADLNAARNLATRGEVTHPDLIAPRHSQLRPSPGSDNSKQSRLL